MSVPRQRWQIVGMLAIVIAAGLTSRLGGSTLAMWTGKAFGDVLWATMFYLLARLARPRATRPAAALAAGAITAGIEFLKLCHAPALDTLRATRPGGLLLGHTFLWSDFLAYALGITLGLAADAVFTVKR